MQNYANHNENPENNRTVDCTVRAISTLLDQDWDTTYLGLAIQGFVMKNMPSANHVWGAYLKSKGYRRHMIPDDYPDDYTVDDFCEGHPEGSYLLSTQGHVVAIVDGRYVDTWNSGGEIPIFYWTKEE